MPLSVLRQAQQELVCLPGAGASVMEISHRSKIFVEILENAKQTLQRLLEIPETYEVLFLQGGSRLQFSMIPMNFLRGSQAAAEYVITGSWSKKALEEARREGAVHVAWDGKQSNYNSLPQLSQLSLATDAPYVYLTSNETIQGVQFPADLNTGDVPLVCDASSDFLSRPLPMANYDLIYACAQKNCGPAGVTVVIVKKEWLDRVPDGLPGYLDYRNHAAENSMYNTPPTFAIYLLGLVARWVEQEVGGLAAMAELNERKAKLLYDAIDDSAGFYQGHAAPAVRSRMNVTFRLRSSELEQEFLASAAARQLTALKGHRSVGGIRASIYNAMPWEGVEALSQFMREFRDERG